MQRMEKSAQTKSAVIRRSLGLQATLLIVGITALTLGASSWISSRFDNAAMRVSMENTAREVSGLLRIIIDKPMVVGDDTGTAEEFRFLAKTFPDINIAIASFTGNVTYSTTQDDIRQSYTRLFNGAMSEDDRKAFEQSYKTALQGTAPEGRLLSVGNSSSFLHVSPILNEEACHHCHGASQPVLGAMSVLQNVDSSISEASNRTLRGALFSIAGGVLLIIVIFLFIRQRIIKRLESVEATSNRILEGDFNARFTVTGEDELGRVANNLGNMLQSLKTLGVAQSVLKGLSTPSAMCDTDGKIIYVNQQTLDLYGDTRSINDVLGLRIDECVYGRSPHPESVFASTLASRSVQLDKEQPVTGSTGKSMRIRFDANPVYDLEGNLIGAFSTLSDLTHIRANEAAVLEQNATISKTAQEANVLTQEMGRATNALAGQIEVTRQQAANQQSLSDSTVAELEEINQAMADVAKNASQVAEHAGLTKESAVHGSEQSALVTRSMEIMVGSIQHLKEQMVELGQKTEGIGQVMQVIQDIADQTNLLALNAAIEAARAGDAGRGFAVVADEVRKLAEKTMQSTVEVGRTVREIRDSALTSIQAVESTNENVAHSSEQVAVTGEVLQRILQLAESVAGEVQAIAAAAEQQSASIEVVRNSIHSIKNISQDAATATSETETAVRSLIDIAGSLDSIVTGMTAKEEK